MFKRELPTSGYQYFPTLWYTKKFIYTGIRRTATVGTALLTNTDRREKWTSLWYRNSGKVTSYNLHMEHMNKKANIDVSCNSLSESRFKVVLFLLRTAGIQLNMKSVSKVNFMCSATLTLCYYVSIACLCVDSYVNRHQLVTFMKKIRVLITTQLVTWTHISLR
jgi:hypothetical protein